MNQEEEARSILTSIFNLTHVTSIINGFIFNVFLKDNVGMVEVTLCFVPL